MKVSTLCAIALIASAAAPSIAAADADGPDFYRVRGLKPGAALVIHKDNGPNSSIQGYIPHDGRKLKNLGCKGGLTLQQWSNTSPEERERSKDLRWCKIMFKGTGGRPITGWVNGRYLRED